MKNIILLFAFSLKIMFVYSQCNDWTMNLVHNASFEDGDDSYLSSNPCIYGSAYICDQYLDVWESRYRHTSDIDDYGCYTWDWHSPDWFKVGVFQQPITTTAADGQLYIGMSDYELIQQQFFTNNKFDEGEHYILTAYIYLTLHNSDGTDNDYSKSILRFYAAKSKVEYKKENPNQNQYFCTDKYKDHENPNSIFILNDVNLNLLDKDKWIKVQFEFTAPSSLHDWFGIEMRNEQSSSECRWGYVLIDNISLALGCDNNCSSTDGIASICTTNYHTETEPFMVTGLNNITKAKFMIYPYFGQFPIWSKTIMYPQTKLAWDGKEGNSGAEAAAGMYIYKLLLTNDCVEDKEFSGTFTKVNASGTPTQYSIYMDYAGGVSKPPVPCCSLEPDIYIYNQILLQDKTIFSDPPTNSTNPALLYQAVHNIYAKDDIVPASNEVIFRAGNEIDIEPDFDVEYGADFTAEIKDCEELSSGKSLIISCVNDNYYVNDTINLFCFYKGFNEGIKYIWEFGDGTSSMERNPVIVYNDTGIYKIKLTIVDAEKNYAEASKNIHIHARPIIYGQLYNNVECGSAPVEGDTLILTFNGIMLDSIAYAITQEDGSFSFNDEKLSEIDNSLKYGIATKSGYKLQDTTTKYITEWIEGSPTSFVLRNVNEEWISRYSGIDSLDNAGTKVDLLGNIYVAGSERSYSNKWDMVLLKYDSSGTRKWVASYNDDYSLDDRVSDMAIDKDGNCIIVGSVSDPSIYPYTLTALAKYDTSGARQWGAMPQIPGSAASVTIDSLNNISFVSNWSYQNLFNAFTISKFDENGSLLWGPDYNMVMGYDTPYVYLYNRSMVTGRYSPRPKVMTDKSNNLIASVGDSANGFVLAKYSIDGSRLWKQAYVDGNTNIITDFDIDNDGNIYATGLNINSSTNYNWITIKYNPDGVIRWIASYEAGGNISLNNRITVDDLGNIFVTGKKNQDFNTIKYNPEGVLQWESTYDGISGSDDTPSDITLDKNGNIYVTGTFLYIIADQQTARSVTKGATLKYDTDGNLKWAEVLNEFTDVYDSPRDMIVSYNNNVYVTGRQYLTTGFGMLNLVKYSQCPANAANLKFDNHNTSDNEEYNNYSNFLYVYPNPNNGNMQVTYKLNENETGKFELYDMLGKNVYDKELLSGYNTFLINGTMLENGIYFYRAIAGEETMVTDKIIVIK